MLKKKSRRYIAKDSSLFILEIIKYNLAKNIRYSKQHSIYTKALGDMPSILPNKPQNDKNGLQTSPNLQFGVHFYTQINRIASIFMLLGAVHGLQFLKNIHLEPIL